MSVRSYSVNPVTLLDKKIILDLLKVPDQLYVSPVVMMITFVLYSRLNVSAKLSVNTTTICSALHLTKAIVIVIYHYIGTQDQLTLYRCFTLLLMSLVFVRVITLDNRVEMIYMDVSNIWVIYILGVKILIMYATKFQNVNFIMFMLSSKLLFFHLCNKGWFNINVDVYSQIWCTIQVSAEHFSAYFDEPYCNNKQKKTLRECKSRCWENQTLC